MINAALSIFSNLTTFSHKYNSLQLSKSVFIVLLFFVLNLLMKLRSKLRLCNQNFLIHNNTDNLYGAN